MALQFHCPSLQMPVLNYNKIISAIWFFLCLTGIIVQNIFVTIEYFKYPAVSEVLFETEENFVPPAFSLCMALTEIRKTQAFPEGHPCRHDNFLKNSSLFDRYFDCQESIHYNYSLREQLNNITEDISPFHIKVSSSNGSMADYGSGYFPMEEHIDPYLWDGAKCYRLRVNPDDGFIVSSDHLTRLTKYNNWFASIRGEVSKSEIETSFAYLLHDPRTYPRGVWTDLNAASLSSQLFNLRMLSYLKHQTEYLPPPFFSKCQNYTKDHIESLEHCLQNCMQEIIHRKFGKYKTAVQFTLNQNDLKDHNYYYEKSLHEGTKQEEEYSSEIVEFKENCSHQCPVDCVTKSYQSIVVAELKIDQGHYMFLIENKFPATHVKFSPKTSFLEYMIYVASVCGMWFGVCVYDTGIVSAKHVKLFLNQYKYPNNQQIFVSVGNIHLNLNRVHPNDGNNQIPNANS